MTQRPPSSSSPLASPDEILRYLTGVMRGEINPGTAGMKAAELLGKRCGLFEETARDMPSVIIIDDIPKEENE